MHQVFLRFSSKTIGETLFSIHILPLPKHSSLLHFFSSQPHYSRDKFHSQNQHPFQLTSNSAIGSPARVQKLIASQSDPLLAKEIFDYASRQHNFKHSYSTYLTLIVKLGRSRYFSFVDDLLLRMKSESLSFTPALFTHLIKLYGEANLPDKALKTFYTMVKLQYKPSPKHLNCILEILVSHKNYVRPAFDLFKDARRHGVLPNTKSYNIVMRAFCLNGDLSIAYELFNKMFKRDIVPDVESYRILMQALCRKGQVNGAVDLLEDMLNKGYVPDTLSYTTLLNSLCRKKKLREAYKLLCRMKVKGCNPDVVHFNTVILGFCREGRAADACKVIHDMESNGCIPNLVSYRTLVGGLCDQGMFDEANKYMGEMLNRSFSPHFSLIHSVLKGYCNVGRIEEACKVAEKTLQHGEALHMDSWVMLIPRIFDADEAVTSWNILEEALRIEITPHTRIVDAGLHLQDYLIRKNRAKSRKR